MSGDAQLRHIEELKVRRLGANHLGDELEGIGALHLEAVGLAHYRPGARRGALIALELDVVAADLAVVLHPVVHRRSTHNIERVVIQVKQDDIADHVTVVVTHHELLGLIAREVAESVDAETAQQLEGVRAFNVHVGHVVGLIEQHTGLLPGNLLIAPIGVFARYHRVDIRAGARAAQQLHGTPRALQ